MRNAEIAAAFDELGDLYELDGAVVYRVLAYRNAAKAIRESGASVEELAHAGKAASLPGIGKIIAEKIDALLETGSIPVAEKLKAKFPAGLVELTHLPGLGPKRARKLFDELGISSLEELKRAAEQQQLRDIRRLRRQGRGEHPAGAGSGGRRPPKPRTLLSRALAVADELADALREHPASDRVEIAGSARRMTETCKDLDLVATAKDAEALAAAFSGLPLIAEVQSSGAAGVKAVTNNGIGVDLRIVPPENFGNLLQHFTGSGRHNEALRTLAVRRGLHVSEYGVADDATDTTHSCATEEEVYELLGMQYIPPELREDRGELEAAREHRLPELIRVEDIRGDLHCHTDALGRPQHDRGDGAGGDRARLRYLAITDHSATHGFGNDVQPDELLRQVEHIRELNESLGGFTLLAGTEVNVLPDGSLDYADEVLEQLDWVVASLHTSFRMKKKEITDRMIRAMEHPLVDAIGHPTGRLIERREPYDLDIERVVEAAIRTGTFLEINANPNRRDLNEANARLAAEAGAMLRDRLRRARHARRWRTSGTEWRPRGEAGSQPEQVANTRRGRS